ncbi:MAG TPA: TauD/TfdA family dioxygenase [Gammaproteobacteria bacterium]|nr:TauD/TfdA family dioxygenase [Gammaproteobacteria bacterium]
MTTLAQTSAARDAMRGGPFDLSDDTAYRRWRAAKLRDYPEDVGSLRVSIVDAAALRPDEHAGVLARCRKANLAIYALDSEAGREAARDKAVIRRLGRQLGLERLDNNLCADDDGITSLRVVPGGRHGGYIPYTDRALNWHTDGYYNPPEQTIRAILMHCVQPAAEGGENGLLDHELAYIVLRDENPELIAALMRPDAMTIPPNTEGGEELRGAQSGPVFSVEPGTGNLHMRYTARLRNIVWKSDAPTQKAAARLRELLGDAGPGVFSYRLGPGEGVLSNNVLHSRGGFRDGPNGTRLLYRARYYDRIAGTDFNDCFGNDTAEDPDAVAQ